MSAAVATAPSPVPVAHPQTGEFIDGQTLRFAVPTDGTLQFLPGRLEVVAGPDAGREIRFVRLPGEPSVDITFGRTSGPAYSHVQLQNLSQTNPVVLNGRPLADQEIAPLLVDGDRIEMGEIVFVFRGR
jgi:hypothetical protein